MRLWLGGYAWEIWVVLGIISRLLFVYPFGRAQLVIDGSIMVLIVLARFKRILYLLSG